MRTREKLIKARLGMLALTLGAPEHFQGVQDRRGISKPLLRNQEGIRDLRQGFEASYELYLAINQVKHCNTKVHTPKTNGFCERFHRTVADEFVKIAFPRKIYRSLGELREDLDRFLQHYNCKRTHRGYRVRGRTPMRAFEDCLEATRKGVKKAA